MSLDYAGADKLRLWREKPQVMVREVFNCTPDPWQDQILEVFPHEPRIAMKASKGPGKTAVLAWLAWNFLLTRPHPNIAATAISGDNLRDNLWKEMAHWQNRSELLLDQFVWNKKQIFHKDAQATWWMSARTWSRDANSEQQANTLAGLHADYVMAILDESGGIPEPVMVTAEAILTSCKEGHVLQAGNPTHLEGPLYKASTTERKYWHVVEITSDPDDPMRAPRVSKQWAQEQIDKYGRDNPWVLINVFGQFPPSSLNALIGPEEVMEAQRRTLREDQYSWAAMVLGVDVARFGDDKSVIYPRQGPVAFPPMSFRGLDSIHGAGHVNNIWTTKDADACFLDGSGGWATGWADQLRTLGRSPVSVDFSGSPTDPKYYNKRAEMYFETCQWIKNGGVLPEDPDLIGELCAHTYGFRRDKLYVIEKDQVKAELKRSPDHADALCLTHAYPIERAPRGIEALLQKKHAVHHAVTDYEPYERI